MFEMFTSLSADFKNFVVSLNTAFYWFSDRYSSLELIFSSFLLSLSIKTKEFFRFFGSTGFIFTGSYLLEP